MKKPYVKNDGRHILVSTCHIDDVPEMDELYVEAGQDELHGYATVIVSALRYTLVIPWKHARKIMNAIEQAKHMADYWKNINVVSDVVLGSYEHSNVEISNYSYTNHEATVTFETKRRPVARDKYCIGFCHRSTMTLQPNQVESLYNVLKLFAKEIKKNRG